MACRSATAHESGRDLGISTGSDRCGGVLQCTPDSLQRAVLLRSARKRCANMQGGAFHEKVGLPLTATPDKMHSTSQHYNGQIGFRSWTAARSGGAMHLCICDRSVTFHEYNLQRCPHKLAACKPASVLTSKHSLLQRHILHRLKSGFSASAVLS